MYLLGFRCGKNWVLFIGGKFMVNSVFFFFRSSSICKWVQFSIPTYTFVAYVAFDYLLCYFTFAYEGFVLFNMFLRMINRIGYRRLPEWDAPFYINSHP